MVGVTAVLRRVPVIKFRKGGFAPAGHGAAAQSASHAAAPAGAKQGQAPMSTTAINDFELPAKYRRQPISEEEIAHINGGGIKTDRPAKRKKDVPKAIAVLKIPKGILTTSGSKPRAVNLNIQISKE
ncbi:hypothetical protein NE865_09983 [Phthorimaea operculella]|nr:hypothetical protein NE865_09983 [Phthorimaea operculella]